MKKKRSILDILTGKGKNQRPDPTPAQAVKHLWLAVQEAERRKMDSPTMDAIHVLLLDHKRLCDDAIARLERAQ